MFINSDNKKSFNFVAPLTPELGGTINEVPFPMWEKQEIAPAATLALVPTAMTSVITVNANLTAATTITVAPASDLVPGAKLIVVLPCGATARNVTFSTGFEACTVTGEATKTKKAVFVYDGTTYCPTGTAFDAVA